MWQQLVQQGLLGTERQPTPPTLDPALAQYLALAGHQRGAEEGPERTFLQMAALLAQYNAAGRLPEANATLPKLDAMQPAPPESMLPVTDRPSALLRQIIVDFDQKLLIEWLDYLAAQGGHLPHDLLPTLLERAEKDRKLAAALMPCLGERGRWLMALNPAWQIAAAIPIDETTWQTSTTEARSTFLAALRTEDPDRARSMLAATWGQEAAADRAALLATLRVHLSSADVPFLEELLSDRSQHVRAEAVRLLATLSGTSLYQTILTQLTSHITVERKWLKRQLAVKLPNSFPQEWKLWGLREQSPLGVRIGQKVGWLVQLIALVPPSALVNALALDAVELLELIRASDYAEALTTALLEGAEHHQDFGFLLAELRHLLRLLELSQIPQSEFVDRFTRCAPILPAAEQQTLLQHYLTITGASAFGDWATLQMMLRLFEQLSPANTTQLLTKQVPTLLQRNTRDYGIGRILLDLAYQLAPAGYPQAEAIFQRRMGEEQPEYVEQFLQIYRLRQRMAQAFVGDA